MQIYYLDHLHHPAAPLSRYGIRRIKYFDNKIMKELARADRRKPGQSGEPLGHCDVRSMFIVVYANFTIIM